MILTARTVENGLFSYSYFIDKNSKMQGRKSVTWKPTGELWIVEHYKNGLLNGPRLNISKDMSCIFYYNNGLEFGQQSYKRTMKSCEKLLSKTS